MILSTWSAETLVVLISFFSFLFRVKLYVSKKQEPSSWTLWQLTMWPILDTTAVLGYWRILHLCGVRIASKSSEVTPHHCPFSNYRNGSISVQELTHCCLILVSPLIWPTHKARTKGATHLNNNTDVLHALYIEFLCMLTHKYITNELIYLQMSWTLNQNGPSSVMTTEAK